MSDKKIFTEGMWYFEPNAGAPTYVLGTIVIDIERFKNFMYRNQKSEKMRISVKRAKSGNIYTEVDTYDPTNRSPRSKEEENERKIVPEPVFQYPEEEIDVSEIPF